MVAETQPSRPPSLPSPTPLWRQRTGEWACKCGMRGRTRRLAPRKSRPCSSPSSNCWPRVRSRSRSTMSALAWVFKCYLYYFLQFWQPEIGWCFLFYLLYCYFDVKKLFIGMSAWLFSLLFLCSDVKKTSTLKSKSMTSTLAWVFKYILKNKYPSFQK